MTLAIQSGTMANMPRKKKGVWLFLSVLGLGFAFRSIINAVTLLALFSLGGSHDLFAAHEPPVLTTHDSLAGHYLSARFAQRQHDTQIAANLFATVVAGSPDNLAIMEEGYKLMLLSGNLDKALNLARQNAPKHEHATLAHVLLALEHVHRRNFSDAEDILFPLYNKKGNPTDDISLVAVPLLLAWSEAAQGDFENATRILAEIDDHKMTPFLLYQAAVMHDIAGNTNAAKKEYDSVLAEGSQPLRVIIAAARFHQRVGETEKATALLDAFTKEHPSYTLNATRILAENPLSREERSVLAMAEVLLELGGFLYSNGLTDAPIRYFRLALHLDPTLDYARMLLASALEQKNRYLEANSVYAGILKESPFYIKAQISRAINLNQLKDANGARVLLLALSALNASDYETLLHLGDIMLESKQYRDAIDAYNKALARIQTPNKQHWAAFYARGIAFERSRQWPSAEADFKQALALNPDQPDVLNYLAYSWLLMDSYISEAAKMLEAALEARPDDAHIIDSYGWALFKMGHYEKAQRYLEDATLKIPYDSTTNDHLGDVYWKTGRKLEARYQWERALILDPDPEDRSKIEVKLSHGLPENAPPVALNSLQAPKANN